jgi:hypothetical protein
MANEDWGGELRELARDLIDIETNTILSIGITGRKMPNYPHALQDIIDKYANFLADEIGVNVDQFCREFDQSVRQEASKPEDPDSASIENDQAAREIEPDFTVGGSYSTALPNGPWSFYLLRWLAANTLGQTERRIPEQHVSVVTRIRVSSDQLKSVTRELKRLGGGNPYIDVTRAAILALEAKAEAERPAMPPAPPEALVMIRKIWDIGADSIVFQTVQQLDGDVIFRVRRGLDLSKRHVLLEAHQQACNVAMSYWRSMFELIAALISGLADRIFDSKGRQGGGTS